MKYEKICFNYEGKCGGGIYITFSGENANVTRAFEAKLVRTARLIPFPLVRSGNISDTISQLIGPNDI